MSADSGDYTQMMSCRLFEAIRKNNLEEVRICIDQGVDLTLFSEIPSQEDKYLDSFCLDDYDSPLAFASYLGHADIMEELLKSGVDPNHVNRLDYQPAMYVAACSRALTVSMIKTLISYGADVNRSVDSEQNSLHYLAKDEFSGTDDDLLSAAKLLLDNGACCDARDEGGYTPLSEACRRGKVHLARLFLLEGADVNTVTTHGTLLTVAAKMCNIYMFDLLLNANADRHLTADALWTPCTRNDCAMIARILETCNLDINMELTQRPGMTILHEACDTPRSKTIQLLLDHGADVKVVSDTGDTALHYVVEYGNCCQIRTLLSYNPPMNVKNNWNRTPLAKLIHSMSSTGEWYLWYSTWDLTFKMLVTAGANVTSDVQHEINQLRIECPDIKIADDLISSIRSLKGICRLVIRGSIPVPVDGSLCKLPIPEILQEYLNFPEFDRLVDEYLRNNKEVSHVLDWQW